MPSHVFIVGLLCCNLTLNRDGMSRGEQRRDGCFVFINSGSWAVGQSAAVQYFRNTFRVHIGTYSPGPVHPPSKIIVAWPRTPNYWGCYYLYWKAVSYFWWNRSVHRPYSTGPAHERWAHWIFLRKMPPAFLSLWLRWLLPCHSLSD